MMDIVVKSGRLGLAVMGALCLSGALLVGCGSTYSISLGGQSSHKNGQAPQLKGPSYEIMTRTVDGLGTILVNGKGLTLYLFVPDDHSSHSTCSGICAAAWPPLLLPSGVSIPLAGGGIDRSLLGTTVRKGGGVQITYKGWPLYRWPQDTSPGDARGQGLSNLGGLWYAVSAQGKPIT
jgi:predicted lipoprotein with Yx(FWY)xxD motif